MKKFRIILLAILFSLPMVYAQAQVEEGPSSMSKGSNNSLSLIIPKADAKLMKKVWEKYLKRETKGGKTKTDRKTGEMFTDNATLVAVGGANTVDIYARFTDSGGDGHAVIWFDLGGAYLSSEMHGDKYTEGEKFLLRYGVEVMIASTELELKDEEKKKKGLEKDLNSLKNKNEMYHREIEIAKQKILDNEAKIEQNVREQEATNTAISDQQGVIDAIKQRLEELRQ